MLIFIVIARVFRDRNIGRDGGLPGGEGGGGKRKGRKGGKAGTEAINSYCF